MSAGISRLLHRAVDRLSHHRLHAHAATVCRAALWLDRDDDLAKTKLASLLLTLDDVGSALQLAYEARASVETRRWHVQHLICDILKRGALGHQGAHLPLVNELELLSALRPGHVVPLNDLATTLAFHGRLEDALLVLRSDEHRAARLAYTGHVDLPGLLEWFAQRRREVPTPLERPGTTSRCVLPLVVWGDEYIETMARFTLPSLLAPGNVPYLSRHHAVSVLAYTSESSRGSAQRAVEASGLQQYAEFEWTVCPDALLRFPDTYVLMSAFHALSVGVARDWGAHYFFLAPDIVVANNFYEELDRRRQAGRRVVFVPGVMLDREGFGRSLGRAAGANAPIDLSPAQLVTLGLPHLHASSRRAVYGRRMSRASASITLWPTSNGGYVAHGFHHTPYMVAADTVQRYDGSLFVTYDGDFAYRILGGGADLEDCDLVAGAWETTYFELSGIRNDPVLPFDLHRIARWGARQGPVSQWLFRQRARISARPEIDMAVETEVDAVVASILREIDEIPWATDGVLDPAACVGLGAASGPLSA